MKKYMAQLTFENGVTLCPELQHHNSTDFKYHVVLIAEAYCEVNSTKLVKVRHFECLDN